MDAKISPLKKILKYKCNDNDTRGDQLNFLFWNVQSKPIHAELVDLISHLSIDIVVLAEYSEDGDALLRQLAAIGLNFFLLPNIGCNRINIFTNISPGFFHIRRETGRYTIREFRKDGHLSLLMLFAHLPSKLSYNENDQAIIASKVREDLEEAEDEAKHRNSIVVGDLNMNPFEAGVVSANSFNAISCLATAMRESRVVQGEEYRFFYNPMWNLLGDHVGSPGTFFHTSPTYDSHFWNIFDQVLVRPQIASRLDVSTLKVVTSTLETSFISEKGHPNISDHLPIVFSFDSLPRGNL